jgi:hypothetical protein
MPFRGPMRNGCPVTGRQSGKLRKEVLAGEKHFQGILARLARNWNAQE